ncbi:hypothetical protein AUP68_10245 [Ilyonectria robusta]
MLHAFASSVCEALPAQVVADVFFLHERGSALGWYTFALATGSLSAVAASYMLAGGLSYNLFFWVEFAIGCVFFIATFFFLEESMYLNRMKDDITESTVEGVINSEKDTQQASEQIEDTTNLPRRRKTYAQQLKVIDQIDHQSPVFMMMIRSFTYFAVPPVFWVCTTYGLVSIAAFVGYLAAAIPFSTLPDRFAARLTRRNGNIHEAEHRLWCLAVVLLVAPASLILYGYSAEKQLHWIGLIFAVGLFQFGMSLRMCFYVDR